MLYTPAAIITADKPIAVKHSVGAEKRLFISAEAVIPLGEFTYVEDGSGTWTADSIFSPPTAGTDLAAVVQTALVASAAPVLTVVGTNAADGALTGTVTFAAPSWVANQQYVFQTGVAKDVTPGVTGQVFKTITGVSGTNANRWGSVRLYQLPSAASWASIDFVESVRPQLKYARPHSIPDRFDASADVVAGRSNESSLAIVAKHRAVIDGLMRYAGQNCTVRMDVYKQDRVLTERHVFGNCVLAANPDFGDGDTDVTVSAEGAFQYYLGFYAP